MVQASRPAPWGRTGAVGIGEEDPRSAQEGEHLGPAPTIEGVNTVGLNEAQPGLIPLDPLLELGERDKDAENQFALGVAVAVHGWGLVSLGFRPFPHTVSQAGKQP